MFQCIEQKHCMYQISLDCKFPIMRNVFTNTKAEKRFVCKSSACDHHMWMLDSTES